MSWQQRESDMYGDVYSEGSTGTTQAPHRASKKTPVPNASGGVEGWRRQPPLAAAPGPTRGPMPATNRLHIIDPSQITPPRPVPAPPQPIAHGTGPQTTTILHADGTTSTLHPNGMQDVRTPEGRCWRLGTDRNVVHSWHEPPAPQWHPPHPIAARQPDGSTVVYHPDGSKELWIGDRRTARFTPDGRPQPEQ